MEIKIITDTVNETKGIDDYRKYVGGNWDLIGPQQFAFLKKEGLQPWHTVLDIGCGALRVGKHLIDYLDPDRYYGVDHHKELILAGYEKELNDFQRDKRPRFVITDDFYFSPIPAKIDYAVAKSVFTHLTPDKIKYCLGYLHQFMKPGGVFYATIFVGDPKNNLKESHDNKKFSYFLEDIQDLAPEWDVTCMGNVVGKKQTMLKFVPKPLTPFPVTVVTAAFREANMPKVYNTLMNQTQKDWQWLIVNDGQKGIRDFVYRDDRMIGEIDADKVSFIDIREPMGRFGLYSRNVGAMVAKHDHILFLDDDNYYPEDFIEKMIAKEMETGKIPFSDLRIIGKKEGSTVDRMKKTGLGRSHIDLGCIMYRKDHFRKYGYFEDTRQVTFDFDFMNKIIQGEGEDRFVKADTHLIFNHKRY